MKWAHGYNAVSRLLRPAAVTAMVSVLVTVAQAQNSQYLFDETGNLALQMADLITAPQILGQPQTQVVIPGEVASFSVVVANTSGVSYQWLFNASAISGATTDSLLLTNVSPTNEGLYSVTVSNSSGSVPSHSANLYIDSRGCGMPDSWQLAYFGNLTTAATGDYDGDSVDNLQEFLDGTNPTNSASVLYRLTVLNDAGSVNISPSQAAYTNGQTVTLTAIASPPGVFRGWFGDTNTTSNPITLTMNTNKTVTALLGITYNLTWTNLAGGDWNVASNWSPNVAPLQNDNVFITSSATVTLNTPAGCANFTMGSLISFPTLTGSGTLTIHGTGYWLEGTMTGGGSTIISPGATLNIPGSDTVYLSSRTVENGGTILWTGPANIYTVDNTVITNRAGALFDAQNAASFYLVFFGGNPSRIDNAGTFRKSGAGTTSVGTGIAFNNYNTLNIQNGILSASGGYTSYPNALLNCAIGGATAGTGFGQLQVAGTVGLDGTLAVTFTNGFIPATSNSLPVVTATALSGMFANFNHPSNVVNMQVSYTPNSVLVLVTGIANPQFMLLPPQISGSNINLTWTAISNLTYRLEFKSDLNPINWTAVPGDIIATTNQASKSDILTRSNRFYRVQVLP
jgi:hypothetical protein